MDHRCQTEFLYESLCLDMTFGVFCLLSLFVAVSAGSAGKDRFKPGMEVSGGGGSCADGSPVAVLSHSNQCFKTCVRENCGGLAVEVGGKGRCAVTTTPCKLPVGQWTLYYNTNHIGNSVF